MPSCLLCFLLRSPETLNPKPPCPSSQVEYVQQAVGDQLPEQPCALLPGRLAASLIIGSSEEATVEQEPEEQPAAAVPGSPPALAGSSGFNLQNQVGGRCDEVVAILQRGCPGLCHAAMPSDAKLPHASPASRPLPVSFVYPQAALAAAPLKSFKMRLFDPRVQFIADGTSLEGIAFLDAAMDRLDCHPQASGWGMWYLPACSVGSLPGIFGRQGAPGEYHV